MMTVCEISTKMYICRQDEKIGGLSSFSSFGLKAEDFIDKFDFVILGSWMTVLLFEELLSINQSVNLRFDLEL